MRSSTVPAASPRPDRDSRCAGPVAGRSSRHRARRSGHRPPAPSAAKPIILRSRSASGAFSTRLRSVIISSVIVDLRIRLVSPTRPSPKPRHDHPAKLHHHRGHDLCRTLTWIAVLIDVEGIHPSSKVGRMKMPSVERRRRFTPQGGGGYGQEPATAKRKGGVTSSTRCPPSGDARRLSRDARPGRFRARRRRPPTCPAGCRGLPRRRAQRGRRPWPRGSSS
jgi:hypothetical protein